MDIYKGSIADKAAEKHFRDFTGRRRCQPCSQAGVRYSITHPDIYIESNLIGFYNILEACRHSYDENAAGVEHRLRQQQLCLRFQ